MPGPVLWRKTFDRGEFSVEPVQTCPESYYSPANITFEPNSRAMLYKYTFNIDSTDAFVQTGTAKSPVVYWLTASHSDPFARQRRDAAGLEDLDEPLERRGGVGRRPRSRTTARRGTSSRIPRATPSAADPSIWRSPSRPSGPAPARRSSASWPTTGVAALRAAVTGDRRGGART